MKLACFVATLVLAVLAHQASATTNFNNSGIAWMIQYHNQQRSATGSGMVGLNWDDTLATVAQDYANRCNYTHNDFRYNNYTALGGTMSSVGENIAYSTEIGATIELDGPYGWQYASNYWGSELQYWSYPNNCQAGKVCGHYTQIVWAATTLVGCGVALCDPLMNTKYNTTTSVFVVCDYAIAGNWYGQQPYTLNPSGPVAPPPQAPINYPPPATPVAPVSPTPTATPVSPTPPASPVSPTPTTSPSPIAAGPASPPSSGSGPVADTPSAASALIMSVSMIFATMCLIAIAL